MKKTRRESLWRYRCHWSVFAAAATCLVILNGVTNLWLLHPARTPSPIVVMTSVPPEPTTCDRCLDSPPPTTSSYEDPISNIDLRLGRWDSSRSYRLYDYAATGELYPIISENRQVCLATQSTIDRLHELLSIAAHWSGPMSVAVFVAGDELAILRAYVIWLYYCHPEVISRMALHIAFPAEKPGIHENVIRNGATNCHVNPLVQNHRRPNTVAWRSKHPYPQNHLRNLARKNCQTPYVFLVDIDIVPSKGMAESLDQFLATTPKCQLCAYVVPTYELDTRVNRFPANKTDLIRLARKKLAVPFHRKVFIYNQYASNFSKWEETGGNESSDVHESHNVTNFELLYEPFYVAADTVPVHDERFVGYGYTRNTQPRGRRIPRIMMEAKVPVVPHWLCRLSYGEALTNNMFCGGHFLIGGVSSCQVYEMFLLGYQFRVLSPIFTIHWGLQSRTHRPLWREKQNVQNRKRFETFKRELYARYRKDPLHLLRRPTKPRKT